MEVQVLLKGTRAAAANFTFHFCGWYAPNNFWFSLLVLAFKAEIMHTYMNRPEVYGTFQSNLHPVAPSCHEKLKQTGLSPYRLYTGDGVKRQNWVD